MSTFVVASIHVCIAFRLLGQNNRDASSSIQWKMQPRQTHFQKTDVGLKTWPVILRFDSFQLS